MSGFEGAIYSILALIFQRPSPELLTAASWDIANLQAVDTLANCGESEDMQSRCVRLMGQVTCPSKAESQSSQSVYRVIGCRIFRKRITEYEGAAERITGRVKQSDSAEWEER